MVSDLVVKKRRPINKKEARFIKEGLSRTHNLDLPILAGRYEIGKTDKWSIYQCRKCKIGDVITMILDLDKLELYYIINGKQYPKAFSIEKTRYRAAVVLSAKRNKIKLLPNKYLRKKVYQHM